MKIAAATNDGYHIAPDFGRAMYYAVLTVEEGIIVGRELRQKVPQGWYSATGHIEHHGPAGTAPETVHRHDALADPIRDCQAVLAAGMDPEDRAHFEAIEIWPILTEPGPIEAAVQAFLAGTLVGR